MLNQGNSSTSDCFNPLDKDVVYSLIRGNLGCCSVDVVLYRGDLGGLFRNLFISAILGYSGLGELKFEGNYNGRELTQEELSTANKHLEMMIDEYLSTQKMDC